MKHCNKCNTIKPIEEFGKRKRSPDGFQYRCKSCRRIEAKKYRERPEAKEHYRQYVENNREKIRAYQRAYYEDHRELLTERESARRKTPADRERRREYNREYHLRPEVKERQRQKEQERYVNDPHFRARAISKAHERRAKIMGVSKKDREDATAYMIMIKNIACYYCGKTEGVFHIDHVQPLARQGSHLWHNLVNACDSCNLSKNAKTYEEFIGKVDIRHYCMQGV